MLDSRTDGLTFGGKEGLMDEIWLRAIWIECIRGAVMSVSTFRPQATRQSERVQQLEKLLRRYTFLSSMAP